MLDTRKLGCYGKRNFKIGASRYRSFLSTLDGCTDDLLITRVAEAACRRAACRPIRHARPGHEMAWATTGIALSISAGCHLGVEKQTKIAAFPHRTERRREGR